MNVTLIRPPVYAEGLMGAQRVPCLGIAYIAAAARKAGHQIDIVDMCGEDIEHTEIVQGKYVSYGMPFSALEKRLRYSDVFGFTCMFSQDWVFHRELINYVKKLYPEGIMVAGGEHISALPEYCLTDCQDLDFCIIGEGEETFVRLLEAIEKKNSPAQVLGLVYRSKDKNAFYSTERAARIKDIDNITPPAWDLTPMENYLSREMNYHIKRGRTIPMLASRGCPYQCTFCSNVNMWSNPWIGRNPKFIVDEMESYIKIYEADNFVFSDLTAAVSRENITSLCQEILRRRLNITWQLPTIRTESIDRDILELMYNAGCRDLDLAIESGSERVLLSVHKRSDLDRMLSLVEDGLRVGMNLSANIVLGLPAEGIRDFFKTFFLMMRLAILGLQETNVFPFVPYPGSKLFSELFKKNKIKLEDSYFYSLFGYADIRRPVSWSERFGPRTLGFLRLFLLVSFYSMMFICRPKRIWRLFIGIVYGKHNTKLQGVLRRVAKNVKVYLCKRK